MNNSQIRTLQVGDFYYGDGTLWPGDAATVVDPSACVGVVYWVGNPHSGEPGHSGDTQLPASCTHGRVIGLKKFHTRWRNGGQGVSENVWTKANCGVDITNETAFQGYSNTNALRRYNQQEGLSADLIVQPIVYIDGTYKKQYPISTTACSNWFWPSISELSITSQEVLNASLGKLSGTDAIEGLYMSSSEIGDGNNKGDAWAMSIYSSGYNQANVYKTEERSNLYQRPVLAF